MSVINKFRRLRYKRTVFKLRTELAFWGVDTSDLSDEELKERVLSLGKILASTGVSLEQAGRNLTSTFKG